MQVKIICDGCDIFIVSDSERTESCARAHGWIRASNGQFCCGHSCKRNLDIRAAGGMIDGSMQRNDPRLANPHAPASIGAGEPPPVPAQSARYAALQAKAVLQARIRIATLDRALADAPAANVATRIRCRYTPAPDAQCGSLLDLGADPAGMKAAHGWTRDGFCSVRCKALALEQGAAAPVSASIVTHEAWMALTTREREAQASYRRPPAAPPTTPRRGRGGPPEAA